MIPAEHLVEIKKRTHFKLTSHNKKFRLAILDCSNLSDKKYFEIYNKLKSDFIIVKDMDFLKDLSFKMPQSDVLLLVRDQSIPPSVTCYIAVLIGLYKDENSLILKKNLALNSHKFGNVNKEISFDNFFECLKSTLRIIK